MKRKLMIFSAALVYSAMTVGFTACNEGQDHHDHGGHDHEHHDHEGYDHHDHEGHDHEDGDEATVYSCTMKCEGDKTYDEAGDCPKCGMPLEKNK